MENSPALLTATGVDSVPATKRSGSQPAMSADTIIRSLDLDPEDWLWATWRQHLPKPRPNPITPEIVFPEVNLCSVEVLLNLTENNDRICFPTEDFRTNILPYLTEEETSALRQRLGSQLSPAQWATGYQRPSAAFHLAACIGLHKELQTLVESWPDDHYSSQRNYVYNQRPQEIIFGLGDPVLVEMHMRRLKLRLHPPGSYISQTSAYVRAWLAHTEYEALDYIRDSILSAEKKEDTAALTEAFALVKAPEAAPHMLELMLSSKVPRMACQWLKDNPAHAIAGLIPVAAGRGTLADAAIKFLQRMKRKGHEAFICTRLEQELAEIADKIRTKVLGAKKDYIAFDSNTTPKWLHTAVADAIGQKNVKQPTWIDQTDLPAVVVGKYCLNSDQATALLLALQQSQLQSPHLLVSELKVMGDRSSLNNFAWQLFECWLSEGAPSKQKWAMIAVGLFGDDTSALKLVPLIRVWPGESQHSRAVLGLQCLRAIGSDMALMQINGIAQKLKFEGLKQQAKRCMEDIAKDRGLSQAQLEDRIIPACDLDKRGSRVFDFGSRQFQFVLR